MMPSPWEISPPSAEAGDEMPLLILDRGDGPDGRTICIIPGRLSRRTADGEFVRLLDEQDIANAAAILLVPELRRVLADLIEWGSRTGGWDAPCWQDATSLLRQLRTISPHG